MRTILPLVCLVALVTAAAPPASADSDSWTFQYRQYESGNPPIPPCTVQILVVNCNPLVAYAASEAQSVGRALSARFTATCSWCWGGGVVQIQDELADPVFGNGRVVFKVNGQVCRGSCWFSGTTATITIDPLDFSPNEILQVYNQDLSSQWPSKGRIHVWF
ncbi:MAG TPA: hypothetical protein VM681_04955 [Candidatus Thermoplasmatota archaeon]|nr:hypothetical protein [Candidatus Thermoplasmatota archaeon]